MLISNLHAREIIDSRGNPTLEVDVTLSDGSFGSAAVPSGASTGKYEALELRDGDKARYGGKGVLTAVTNTKEKIFNAVKGKDFKTQEELDNFLIELDGTENKGSLGANAILGVSLAYAWAVSTSQKRPLYQYVGELYGNSNFVLPRPMFNIMNGGKHANWATDIQEYMVLPMNQKNFAETLRAGSEVYHALEKIIKGKGLSTQVGDEGGFAPLVGSNKEALDMIMQAIEAAGYKPGVDVKVGFDAAATEFFNEETSMYSLKRDNKTITIPEMVNWVGQLLENYPVESFEDMFSEDDFEGWGSFMAQYGSRVQLVGDDLLVTNAKRVAIAIEKKLCNALLVKVNQIGSLTETLAAMKMAEGAGWKSVMSHRSGETEDITIAHLAVGTGCGQIKTGAPSRSERTAKYNELLRIAEQVEK